MMKKIVSLLLTVAMLLSLAVSAMASSFVSSPTRPSAPELEGLTDGDGNTLTIREDPSIIGDGGIIVESHYDNDTPENPNDDCDAALNVLSFKEVDQEGRSDRIALKNEADRQIFQTPAVQTGGRPDARKIWPVDLANDKPGYDLRISQVFDIEVWCTKHIAAHETEEGFNKVHHLHTLQFQLSAEEAEHFVALMHLSDAKSKTNPQWERIPAVVDTTTDIMSFQMDCVNLSPFAVVVYEKVGGGGAEEGEPTSPQTGEILPVAWVAGSVAALCGAALVWNRGKKRA